MADGLPNTARFTAVQAFWPGGMNSQPSPLLLPPSQYQCAFNMLNRGGVVSVRPRYNLTLSVPGTNPQMLYLFAPPGRQPALVAVCDGYIYQSPAPFTAFTQLMDGATNAPIRLDPSARQCFGCVGIKSVQQQSSGALTLIQPQHLLFVSDGLSRPVVWDGQTSPRHSNPEPPDFGLPGAVGPMVFSNSRLWAAQGSRLYASDLKDPSTYTETKVVAEGGFFAFPSLITGLIETADRLGILVFTSEQIYFVKSSVRDRTQWDILPDFVTTILTGLGCVAPKSPVNQFGLTWFYSSGGLLSLNAALNTYRTSAVLYQDAAMKRSKDNLSADKSGICSVSHENFMLCSVPSGDIRNRHTWVLDEDPGGSGQPAWASVWTGVRPVEYAGGVIGGKRRTFFLSLDSHATNDGATCHVWEAFGTDQTEPAGQVGASMQSGYFVIGGLERSMFVAAELHLEGVEGSLAVKASIAANAGGYQEVLNTTVNATRGPYDPNWINESDSLTSYRPQKRILRTRAFQPYANDGSAPGQVSQCAEGDKNAPLGQGRYFSLLVELTGVGAVQGIKLVQDAKPLQNDPICLTPETGGTAIDESDYQIERRYLSL